MTITNRMTAIGVIGSGTMGSGIAQVASSSGHPVVLYDPEAGALKNAKFGIRKTLSRLSEKGKISSRSTEEIFSNIRFSDTISECSNCGMIIEAIIENIDAKKKLFAEVEKIVPSTTILATNTSSLSVTAIASGCKIPERVIGTHFFNPAPQMPLVEIIPGLLTSGETVQYSQSLLSSWNKTAVVAKDTPGFIVNRIARPFYGEALRIFEEGIAHFATIDWAMKELGGFRMGPFELMDLIGLDINYTVTETIWSQFYYDPRYKPSLIQKRMVEAKRLGRKTGIGFYNYSADAENPLPEKDEKKGREILIRIFSMLINEAAEALYLSIASRGDIELAMTKGVNYPRGLLQWADELGIEIIFETLDQLYNTYNEDRYRPSVLLKQMSASGKTFF